MIPLDCPLAKILRGIYSQKRVPFDVAVAGNDALNASYDGCDHYSHVADMGWFFDPDGCDRFFDGVRDNDLWDEYYGRYARVDYLSEAKSMFPCPSLERLVASVRKVYLADDSR